MLNLRSSMDVQGPEKSTMLFFNVFNLFFLIFQNTKLTFSSTLTLRTDKCQMSGPQGRPLINWQLKVIFIINLLEYILLYICLSIDNLLISSLNAQKFHVLALYMLPMCEPAEWTNWRINARLVEMGQNVSQYWLNISYLNIYFLLLYGSQIQ
jgi:hypothetical protein